ncbi:MAG: sugar phosphate nucleotidyltransferase [Candidatus Omnitrophota bacterium]
MATIHDMDVLLLCGGFGTRLRSAIGEKQKVAAEVAGRPFLSFQLERLSQSGFNHVVLAAGFGAEQIEQALSGYHYGMDVELSVEPEALGTGGAIKFARSKGRGRRWVILNGDCFSNVDIPGMIKFHNEKRSLVTLAVAKRDDAYDYGTIEMGADNRITAFREKEKTRTTGYVSVGLYCFEDKAFDLMPSSDKFSVETEFFPKILNNPVYGFTDPGTFLDIGTPERFAEAQRFFRKD